LIPNAANASGNSLVLKNKLSQTESVLLEGCDITTTVLERTAFTIPILMNGRKLFTDTNTALKNIHKAQAFLKAMPEVSFVDIIILDRSGISNTEIKEQVLDEMHVILKRKTSPA
jgi:hypothetical protein